MKKFLSLTLALVMAVALVTFGTAGASAANPANFTDYDSIQYKEAVDVIAALKIIGGYGDNSFRPTGFLSRGAAAKIICNLSLTPAIADGMTAGANSFSDVPSTSSYSGFVSWCVQQKIVSGYADNTFHPYDNLSGNAYLKMLLGALGYDQTIEGYSGAGWSNNVRIRAQQIGLVDSSFDGSAYITREMAALLALRMLQSDEVQYSTTTTVSGKNAATPRPNTGSSDGNINKDGILQFAENHFNTLAKKTGADATDAFNRPATSWTLGNTPVGTYLASVARTYTTDVAASQIYRDLGLSASVSNVKFYVNGADKTVSGLTIAGTGNDGSRKLSEMATENIIGNGTEVSVFYDSDANSINLNAIAWYGAEVSSVRSANSSRNRAVLVNPAAKGPTLGKDQTFNNAFETESFDADAMVAYTYSVPKNEIQDMKALRTVSGSVSRFVAGSSLTVDGTTYPYAKMISFEGDLKGETDLNSSGSFIVYLLEANGSAYALWVENGAVSVDGYALVLKTEAAGTFDDARAKLLFSNGKTSVVELSKDFPTTDVIARYTVKDGKYTLNAADAANVSYVTTDADKASKTVTKVDSFTVSRNVVSGLEDANTKVTISADARTIFVVGKNDSFTVYTGIRNVPNVSGTSAYTYHENGIARIVFVTATGTTTTSRDLVFVAANTKDAANLVYEDDNVYREYNAVVDGRVTTIVVSANNADLGGFTVVEKEQKSGAENCVILGERTINSDGIVTAGKAASTAQKARGYQAPANDVIVVGTATGETRRTLTLSDDLNAYKVDADGKITDVTNNLRSLSGDSSAYVYYTYEDSTVTNLFVVEVE